MANYGVVFNGVGNVSLPTWTAAADFNSSVLFKTPATLATEGITGNVGSAGFIAIFDDGSAQFTANDVVHSTPVSLIEPDEIYRIDINRVAGLIDFTLTNVSTDTVLDSASNLSNTDVLSYTLIGDTQGLVFNGEIREVILGRSGDARHYLSDVNSGSVWKDIGGGAQDATLNGLATDGSQWQFYGVVEVGGGTITVGPFKNNTGDLLANKSNVSIALYDATTNELEYELTGLSFDASGFLIRTDDLFIIDKVYIMMFSDGVDVGVISVVPVL